MTPLPLPPPPTLSLPPPPSVSLDPSRVPSPNPDEGGFHIAGDPEPDRFCHSLWRQLERVDWSLRIYLAILTLEESESEADISAD